MLQHLPAAKQRRGVHLERARGASPSTTLQQPRTAAAAFSFSSPPPVLPGGARARARRRLGVFGPGTSWAVSGQSAVCWALSGYFNNWPMEAPGRALTTHDGSPPSQLTGDETNLATQFSPRQQTKKAIMAPPPPPLLPELMDELVEEILLRLPLDSPAHLVGAALVCRRWRRLVSGAGFRRRLRAFHRSPPMLGFLCSTLCNNQNSYITHHTHFVPTMTSSCSTHAGDHPGGWRADDARHGRVLLSRRGASGLELMVWDPTTDHLQELPALSWPTYSWKAAVLCASAACDHLDCHLGGPFRVVYIGVGDDGAFSLWSKPVSIELRRFSYTKSVQSVLVGKALYFMFHENNEDGGLGFATAIEHRLYLWSRKDGSKEQSH
nr:unnamed protein product [Digitaria exilis]